MRRYEPFLQQLVRLGVRDSSAPVPAEQIRLLRQEFPGLPEDYLDFLEQVGWGDVGGGWLMICNGPITPDDIFDGQTARTLGEVLFVADNLSGDHWGYLPRQGWRLIEVDSARPDDPSECDTDFEGFIWKRLRLETSNDEDS